MKVYLIEFVREQDFYYGSAVITATDSDTAFEILIKQPDAQSIEKEKCTITEINTKTSSVHFYDSGYF